MLKKIEFENYRCFENASLDFRDMTVIVGKNNAGKSTIVEALRLVAAAQRKSKTAKYVELPKFLGLLPTCKGFILNIDKLKIDLRTVIYFYTGDYARVLATFDNNINIQIYLYTESVYVVIYDHDRNNVYSRSHAQKIMTDDIQINILPQISLILEKEKIIHKTTVDKDIDTYLTSRHFRNEIRYYKEKYFEAFKEFAERTWPGLRVRELRYNPSESEYIRLFIQDNHFPAEIGLMGSGLQMWLQIIWFISRCIDSDTIILDEPDVYMHPDMQRRILDIIKDRYSQIIIATHSVEIITAVDARNIITVNKDARKMRYANSLKAVQEIINSLGSVHNLALVRLSDAKKCLFVEGKDIRLLAQFKEKLGIYSPQPLDTLPCIPLGGCSNLKEAFGFSKYLHEETAGNITCICILDSDYFSDEKLQEQMDKANAAKLDLRIWKKKEIENYLLIPKAIFRILKKPMTEYKEFCEKLEKLIDAQWEEIILQRAEQLQNNDPDRKGLSFYYKEAKRYVDAKWTNLEDKLSIVSGKQTISLINSWIKKEYGVSCSQAKIIFNIEPADIDDEMIDVIRALCT